MLQHTSRRRQNQKQNIQNSEFNTALQEFRKNIWQNTSATNANLQVFHSSIVIPMEMILTRYIPHFQQFRYLQVNFAMPHRHGHTIHIPFVFSGKKEVLFGQRLPVTVLFLGKCGRECFHVYYNINHLLFNVNGYISYISP